MSVENKKKERVIVWMTPDTIRKCERAVDLEGCKNMSQFIEKGMVFYTGFVETQKHTDFLAKVIVEAVEGTIDTTENRLARLMFKEAVELAKLTHMLASINELDEDTLERLHYKCVQEVKKINGTVKFEDAVKSNAE
jgi:hypothetical protein